MTRLIITVLPEKQLRFYRADEIQQRRRGAGRETEGYTPPNSESHQS